METLKKAFQFYISGSIHVALAVCALVQLTFVKYGYDEGYDYILFLFFGSIVAYNFVKYSKVANLYHSRLTKSMRGIQVLTGASLLAFIVVGFQIAPDTLLLILPFLLLTIVYAIPIFPNTKNLRSIGGIKIFIIAAVWSGMTVYVPIIHAKAVFSLDFVIETIQRFIFIVVMMLPFEIRDLQFDDKSLETVPQAIGITRTKVFGSILLVIFLLFTVVKEELASIEILSTIGITTISLFFLWGTERRQSEYYCSFWVESIPMVWLGIYIALQSVFFK